MTRRPETLETLTLTLQMLRYIPRGRKVTAKDLHEQLLDAGVQRDVSPFARGESSGLSANPEQAERTRVGAVE